MAKLAFHGMFDSFNASRNPKRRSRTTDVMGLAKTPRTGVPAVFSKYNVRALAAARLSLIPLGTRREGVTVYACPLRQRKTATCTTPCANCGKTVTLNDHGSRYAQSGVSYVSPAWKSLYAERTGVERAFSLWTQFGGFQ